MSDFTEHAGGSADPETMPKGHSARTRTAALRIAGLLVALAPAVLAFTGPRTPQGLLVAGVAHATTDVTNGHHFSINVQRAQRIPRSALPDGCTVAAGLDAVVVHVILANLEARPFHGVVEHFVLAWEANGQVDGGDAEDVTCAAADPAARYFGALNPPIPPHGLRRVRLFYAVPTGAPLVRLDYHDDDAPARFALPH